MSATLAQSFKVARRISNISVMALSGLVKEKWPDAEHRAIQL
jgi:hypothetical protein